MDLNEGLTKIIKEYPDLRRYSTDPDVTRGFINLQMENKRKEFNNFLKEFGESIQKLLPKNYKINCGAIANNGGILHITIFNEDYSNYYLTYLFETNRKWVYLCLGLNLNWVYGSTLNDFRNLATNFRNYVQFINKKDTENIIDFSKFSKKCDLEGKGRRTKKYRAANIYCKYYEFNEDKNIFLPSKSELENDLMEFIDLYQYFIKCDNYFANAQIIKPKETEIKNSVCKSFSDYLNENNFYFDEETIENLYHFFVKCDDYSSSEQIVKSKETKTENNLYKSFYDYLLKNGFYFDREIIENYLLSLKVKPFVILTGNSGTGKTKLSQLFAKYLNDKDNYKIIPVGANWAENRHIL